MFDVEIFVPTLETSRLILRPLRLTDASAIQHHFPHWEIVEFLDPDVPWPYPPDGALHYLTSKALPAVEAGREYRWAITLKSEAGDQLIGAITLYPYDDHDNASFWLALPWQGQGLMKEAVTAMYDFAFYDLGMRHIRLRNADSNTGSHRLQQAAGAVVTAIEPNAPSLGGFYNRVRWLLRRQDWDRHRTGFIMGPQLMPHLMQGTNASVGA